MIICHGIQALIVFKIYANQNYDVINKIIL